MKANRIGNWIVRTCAALIVGMAIGISLCVHAASASDSAEPNKAATKSEQERLSERLNKKLDQDDARRKSTQQNPRNANDGSQLMKGWPWCNDPKKRDDAVCKAYRK